jgi:DNA-directed RNA polymerase specialized sigma24 family protein
MVSPYWYISVYTKPRYGPAIYSRCRLLLTDDGAAEDATQETFLRVWRRLDHRVPDSHEALYWICRVAERCWT